MTEPIFWLGLSILLVAICLAVMLAAAIPAFQELARAARSAEKLFDTLSRELPPTLESIRLTGLEISDLTDDISEGVDSAGRVVKQVDQGLRGVQRQAQEANVTTRSLVAGAKAAWKNLTRSPAKKKRSGRPPGRTRERLMPSDRPTVSPEPISPREEPRSPSPQNTYNSLNPMAEHPSPGAEEASPSTLNPEDARPSPES